MLGKLCCGLGVQLFAVHRKQREISLGAADIARENEISMSHGSLLTTKDRGGRANRNSEYPAKRKGRKSEIEGENIHRVCPSP